MGRCRAVKHCLAQQYAELRHDHVVAVVQHVHARFNRSTVRDYVPLLVERRATEVLAGLAAVAEVGQLGVATGRVEPDHLMALINS